MLQELGSQVLAAVKTRVAVLSVGRYSLPVRFRIRGSAVECQVPTWSGVGDFLEGGPAPEVALVAVEENEPHLRWLFVRGTGALVADPDWDDLHVADGNGVATGDLYQLLRIVPKRIEWADERRGWGYRETVDF